jgi:hypothetical protein
MLLWSLTGSPSYQSLEASGIEPTILSALEGEEFSPMLSIVFKEPRVALCISLKFYKVAMRGLD